MKFWTPDDLDKAYSFVKENPNCKISDLKNHMLVDNGDAVDLWLTMEADGSIVSEKDPAGETGWRLRVVDNVESL